ncbi:MAG: AAA family ATPase [Actinophytocola sp.]|nr:AAA family ATPase [Actinophytocola sp.]
MVGRAAELEQLRQAFAAACDGTPTTVLITGEAGAGKSRIVETLATEVGAKARVLIGGCVAQCATELPFAPFTAALRELTAELGPEELLGLLPPGAAPSLAVLLPGLGSPEPVSDSDQARARLFEYLLTLLTRLAEQRPCVLVIEDAHWADRSSRDLIGFLVRSQQAAPGLLIVVTHRTEELTRTHPVRRQAAELARLPWFERLDVPRLTPREVAKLARQLLGRDPDPALLNRVYQRSEGNPLFVESLCSSGQAELEGGIPPSLENLLLDRVTQLPDAAARVVRVASVGGNHVGHRLLATVSRPDDSALRAAVDAAVLTVDGDGYTFRHALIQEAVYQSLLPGERVELHTQYADALAADVTLAISAHAAIELAHHLSAVGDARRAIAAAWPAAIKAGAHTRGEELATRALAALDPDADRVRTALLLERRGVLRASLGLPSALDDHRASVEVIPDTHPAMAYLLNSLATHLLEVPAPDEAQRAASDALSIACRVGDPSSEASAMITLAALASRTGDLAAQQPRLAKARTIAQGIGATQVALRAWHYESHLLQAYGRLDEAAALARAGLSAATDAGLARALAPTHALDLAGALIGAGDWDAAFETIDYGLGLAPSPNDHAHLRAMAGFIALHRGAIDDAELALTQAAELMAATRFMWPLLVIGAQVVKATATAEDTVRLRGEDLLAKVRDQAARIRISTPVQAATAATFTAITSEGELAAWQRAVTAWQELRQPLRLGQALLGQAEAMLVGGAERTAIAPVLRQVRTIATELRAEPLAGQAAVLARRGGISLEGKTSRQLTSPGHGLTQRELEILRLVADGRSNAEIAAELFIAPKTASVHVSHILAKLDVANRVEAAAAAHRRGILGEVAS